MTEGERQARLAVLVDGDNVPAKHADWLFEEVAKLGSAMIRRVYGDFSSPGLGAWAEVMNRHAIVPRQQFANVPGKNATDIALVVDAMDLLHEGKLDGFCIVSSDSDYTRLATRMREHGLQVFGFGTKATAESFRRACHGFVEIEALVKEAPAKPATTVAKGAKTPTPLAKKPTPPAKKVAAATGSLADAERLLLRVLGELGVGASWVAIETIHQQALKLFPGFKVTTYGSKKLRDLIARIACLECKEEGASIRVRMKLKSVPTPIATKAVPVIAKRPALENVSAVS